MDVTLLISSGTGPKECQFAALGIGRVFAQEAKTVKLDAAIIETNNPKSVLLNLSGPDAEQFAQIRCGSVQWISPSPFRPRHKRKNWFVSVSKLPALSDMPQIDSRDIVFTATRASGPGGQHVNKTNSAVRAVHGPSGIAVTSQEERSQYANKKSCLIKLAAIFADRAASEEIQRKAQTWQSHKTLERGNPVRVYKGKTFKLV